jgi:anti-anti-sigma regulatory factor
MVLATLNKQHRLLYLNYVGRVSPAELESARNEVQALLVEFPAGFRLLADLSQLESMDPACMTELGRTMDLLDQHGVSLIIRVIPDSSKDIGLNILTIFHYARHPRVITCQNLAKALRQLSLQA